MGGHYTPGHTIQYGRKIWMLIWGPLAGFILGTLAAGAYFAMTSGFLPFSELLWFVLVNGMLINFLWGCMNLLPVFPLDGGQIFLEFVRWKYPLKDDAFSYTVSMFAAGLASACGIAAYVIWRGNPFPALFFGWLAYYSYQLRKFDILTGGAARWEEQAPRQPWEQDADWWKKWWQGRRRLVEALNVTPRILSPARSCPFSHHQACPPRRTFCTHTRRV